MEMRKSLIFRRKLSHSQNCDVRRKSIFTRNFHQFIMILRRSTSCFPYFMTIPSTSFIPPLKCVLHNWFFKGDSSMGVILENQYKISTNLVVFSLIRQSIKALSIWRRLIPPTPKNLCLKKTKQLCKNSRGLRGSG